MAKAQHIRQASGSDEVDLEIDDARPGAAASRQASILLLSRDTNLVETIKQAAPRAASLVHASDLDHAVERLSDLRPGVLVADTAHIADVAAMVAQLTQHFPELVVVIAGRREDSDALMQLTAAGRIFRFLLTPLSHGQTRLALEAAVTQHIDLAAALQRQGSAGNERAAGTNYVLTYGALAAGLLFVIGGVWFGFNHFAGKPETPVSVVSGVPAQSFDGVPERPDPVQAEIALAKAAFDQGKFDEPAGESALDLYLSALALAPDNEVAKAGVRSVADKVLERAEAALIAERLEAAVLAIERARNIDSSHPRLSFLDTQIERERERLTLTQAQEVGTRVRALVAQANDRMRNGRLLVPSSANARDALLEARRLDPTDPAVVQSIRELGRILVDEAGQALGDDNPDEARLFAAAARQLGSAGSVLAAIERSLAEASRATSPPEARAASSDAADSPTAALIADLRQQLDAGKLIEPQGDSARDSLARLVATAPDRPEVEALARALSTRLLDSGRQAMAAGAFDRSAQLLAAARELGARYDETAIAQAERDLARTRETQAMQANVVSAAVLTRVRMINPVYPESARRRGIEGWVELIFTVTPNGTVEDVEVRNASPTDVFEDSAIRAVRAWRFEPVHSNGERIPQRAMVRLRFAQAD
jgi:TonB family protein